MKKKWVFPPDVDVEIDLKRRLLKARGISDEADAADFLSEKPKLTHDPYFLKDAEESARQILDAVSTKQKICIYGDYDADGVCAVSLLLEILGKLGDGISYYIPSRFDEGYGLNKEAIEVIKKGGADLLVTVDCGSVSASEVEYAKKLGLSIIVTDHHNLNNEPADCLLVNPKQSSCTYPDKELSGCGVAFKLAQIIQRLSVERCGEGKQALTKADLSAVLDLVAIATIGDVMSLLGENRTLVKYGLKTINQGKRKGLQELIRVAGLPAGHIKAEQVAFGIVPHLNAGGRMLSAETGVTLLTAKDEKTAAEAAQLLSENNQERRRIQETAFAEAVRIVEESHLDEPVLIIDSPDTHEGIAGIVAGKIKEKYHKPSLILTGTGDDYWKGTGRSIEGFDLYEMLSVARDLFEKFGGHAGACGFLMKKENLPALRTELRSFAQGILQREPEAFLPKFYIDEVLDSSELTLDTLRMFELFEPFGQKNRKPLLCLRQLVLHKPVFMGEKQQHVRFLASSIPCILFGKAAEYQELFLEGTSVDLLGYAEINRWNGSEKIQFVVLDMRCYNE